VRYCGGQSLLVSYLSLVMLSLDNFINITDLDHEIFLLLKLDLLEFDLQYNWVMALHLGH
jgi:hypothetical protein